MPGFTRRTIAGQLDRVSRPDFQMSVAIQFDELNRRAEERGGFFRFCDALVRRAVRAGFAARADDEMRRAAAARFPRDHAAAAELDVVRDARQRPGAARGQVSSV